MIAQENVISDDGKSISSVYLSLADYVDAARRGQKHFPHTGHWNSPDEPTDFYGDISWNDAAEMAVNGWHDELDRALEIAENAVKLCERERETYTFAPVFDVAGGDVDVARFLAGEPECMVDYPLTVTSKVGRVITVSVGINYSAGVSPDAIKRRGYVIVALAMALSRLGHSIEVWADVATSNSMTPGRGYRSNTRILVKGVNDELDPATLMFALAHPAMGRALCIAGSRRLLPVVWRSRVMIQHRGHAYPTEPVKDLPDGTLYLPGVCSDRDIPNADAALVGYLSELGLLAE